MCFNGETFATFLYKKQNNGNIIGQDFEICTNKLYYININILGGGGWLGLNGPEIKRRTFFSAASLVQYEKRTNCLSDISSQLTCLFFKPGFPSVYYIGTMPRFVTEWKPGILG